MFGCAEIRMELVEKLSDITGLRAETRAGALDDGGIEPEALGDVDARRRTGHSDFQLVRRLQRGLVKSTEAFSTPGVFAP